MVSPNQSDRAWFGSHTLANGSSTAGTAALEAESEQQKMLAWQQPHAQQQQQPHQRHHQQQHQDSAQPSLLYGISQQPGMFMSSPSAMMGMPAVVPRASSYNHASASHGNQPSHLADQYGFPSSSMTHMVPPHVASMQEHLSWAQQQHLQQGRRHAMTPGFPSSHDPLSSLEYHPPLLPSPHAVTSASFSGGLPSSWVDSSFTSDGLFAEPTPVMPSQQSSFGTTNYIAPTRINTSPYDRRRDSSSTTSSPSSGSGGSMYPGGMMHRSSYSGISSVPMPIGQTHLSSTASVLSGHSFFDSSGSINMPPPNPPPDMQGPLEQETQRRAATACNFCRSRKLRCDGNAPCRQCERRELTCVFSLSNTTKRKKRDDDDQSGAGTSDSPEEQTRPLAFSAPSTKSSSGASEKRTSTKAPSQQRPERQNQTHGFQTRKPKRRNTDDNIVLSVESSEPVPSLPTQLTAVGAPVEPSELSATGKNQVEDSSLLRETISPTVTSKDTATTFPIPALLPPGNGSTYWWDHLTRFFGSNTASSMRIISSLLRRFVQSNAIFFGLLHAPTLLEDIRTPEKRQNACPALYFGVLSVAVCDLYSEQLEPWTANMEAAKGETRKMSEELAEMGRQYLAKDMTSCRGPSVSMGQAASILALVEQTGGARQIECIRLLEGIVDSLPQAESITLSPDSPLLTPVEPSSDLYYARPPSQATPAAEIAAEMLSRLCWSSVSHWCRLVINRPDEDYGPGRELITQLRPQAFWEPSRLPSVLSIEFYRSNNFMRAGRELSSIQYSVWSLSSLSNADEEQGTSHEAESLSLLVRLDQLEQPFLRYRFQNDAERGSLIANSADMLCRVHVATRMSLWRKRKLWYSMAGRKWPVQLPNTVQYWCQYVAPPIVDQLESESGQIQKGGKSTLLDSQFDSHLHHLRLAVQIQQASENHPQLEETTRTLIEAIAKYADLTQARQQQPVLFVLFTAILAEWNEVKQRQRQPDQTQQQQQQQHQQQQQQQQQQYQQQQY